MKKNLLLVLSAMLLLSACKKLDDVAPAKDKNAVASTALETLASGPTTVVASIKRFADPTYSYVSYYYQTDFTYQGKQLFSSQSKAIKQLSGEGIPNITNYFYYDTDLHLKSTSINNAIGGPHISTDIVGSEVTYSGSQIASIDFVQQDGAIAKTFNLTYDGDKLVQIFEPNTIKITYSYDDSGNNIKEVSETYADGAATGTTSTVVNNTFDTQLNFQKSLPLWVYFKCMDIALLNIPYSLNYKVLQTSFTNTPGANNPLDVTTNGVPTPFTYKYDASGYPFQICDKTYIWQYTYTTVE